MCISVSILKANTFSAATKFKMPDDERFDEENEENEEDAEDEWLDIVDPDEFEDGPASIFVGGFSGLRSVDQGLKVYGQRESGQIMVFPGRYEGDVKLDSIIHCGLSLVGVSDPSSVEFTGQLCVSRTDNPELIALYEERKQRRMDGGSSVEEEEEEEDEEGEEGEGKGGGEYNETEQEDRADADAFAVKSVDQLTISNFTFLKGMVVEEVTAAQVVNCIFGRCSYLKNAASEADVEAPPPKEHRAIVCRAFSTVNLQQCVVFGCGLSAIYCYPYSQNKFIKCEFFAATQHVSRTMRDDKNQNSGIASGKSHSLSKGTAEHHPLWTSASNRDPHRFLLYGYDGQANQQTLRNMHLELLKERPKNQGKVLTERMGTRAADQVPPYFRYYLESPAESKNSFSHLARNGLDSHRNAAGEEVCIPPPPSCCYVGLHLDNAAVVFDRCTFSGFDLGAVMNDSCQSTLINSCVFAGHAAVGFVFQRGCRGTLQKTTIKHCGRECVLLCAPELTEYSQPQLRNPAPPLNHPKIHHNVLLGDVRVGRGADISGMYENTVGVDGQLHYEDDDAFVPKGFSFTSKDPSGKRKQHANVV